MTTEIWVTNFYDQTKQTIPDGKELSSVQKTKLISDLKIFLPPSTQSNSIAISSTHFGHIIDKGITTSISTTRRVDIKDEASDKYKSNHGTWNNPITISRNIGETAFIILPGYGTRQPISIKNIIPKTIKN